MATDDDDAATLRERVRDLEQTVAQQQDTIEQLMPSRRAILAGGAGLVGGAALTGQASAQSAAGQVGTSSEPVDVEAATVSADSVNTEQSTTAGNTVSEIESYVQDGNTSSTVEIDFDGLSDDRGYQIEIIQAQSPSSGSVRLYFNQDDATGNENYSYWDETGAHQTLEDYIELFSHDAFPRISGYIIIPKTDAGDNAVINQAAAGIDDNLTGFAQKGGYSGSRSSMQIQFTGGLSLSNEINLRRIQ